MLTDLLKLKKEGEEKRASQIFKRFCLGLFFPFSGCLLSPLIIAAEDCGGAKETELMHADRGTCTSYHLAESYLDSFSFWLFHLRRTKTL